MLWSITKEFILHLLLLNFTKQNAERTLIGRMSRTKGHSKQSKAHVHHTKLYKGDKDRDRKDTKDKVKNYIKDNIFLMEDANLKPRGSS